MGKPPALSPCGGIPSANVQINLSLYAKTLSAIQNSLPTKCSSIFEITRRWVWLYAKSTSPSSNSTKHAPILSPYPTDRKLGFKEMKQFSQGHTTSESWLYFSRHSGSAQLININGWLTALFLGGTFLVTPHLHVNPIPEFPALLLGSLTMQTAFSSVKT